MLITLRSARFNASRTLSGEVSQGGLHLWVVSPIVVPIPTPPELYIQPIPPSP